MAIIGLACRFPAAANPEEFWRLIRDGREAARLPPDAAEFDADFFTVSPREARAMDPRQRLALELAWELFEDAFILPETQRGQPVAVYLGAMTDDYAVLTLGAGADKLDHHSFTGVSRSMIANKISYAFGLLGPSVAVDSGQSSALTAVHLACASLRTGEAPLAIAGGVHLNLASETATLESEFGAMSTSGHTYAFDERADGYVRSQGGALVLLKPLRAALDDGDRIRAVIRGTAVGNAGHGAGGQTTPSVRGQADVIRRALLAAGLDAGDIDYVEAHGTGTPVGDRVEAQALGEVFAARRERPLRLGSVKTNIGHTGSASGAAGLVKTVLAIENALLPPSLHFAHPAVDLRSLGLDVITEPTPWPAGDTPRRAGVSSFGMGGTNAHLIVEEPPSAAESAVGERDSGPWAWVVTGRSGDALAGQAARLARHLAETDGEAGDVAWSLATTRTPFEHRAVLVGADVDALRANLADLASGRPGAGVITGRARRIGKTAFVFPGQGAQWRGMGAQLYRRFPVFATAFDEAAHALSQHLRLPIDEAMWGGEDALDNTEFAQPALFALEAALAALLRHWGVVPDVVLGHSVGEITAAYVAGVLSLDDAARLVAARGRLMSRLPAGGAMFAVAAGEAEVTPLLDGRVSIAAVNGPNAVVVSGAETSAGAIARAFANRGRRVHRLAVSHAFHSPLMEPVIDEFAAVAGTVSVAEPRITLIDNISGRPAGPGYGCGRHWVEHVRAPVRFAEGVRAAERVGAGVFVEVGPGGGLLAAIEQSLTTRDPVTVVTMPKDQPEVDSLLTAAGRLFTIGADVDWGAVLPPGRRIPLPTYAFVRQRYWLDSAPQPVAQPEPGRAELAESLRNLEPNERRRRLVDLVCGQVAAVLGHPEGHAVDPERAFEDLGLDSLSGVELRNRLSAETGLALPRTLVFDYPTAAAVAAHLAHELLHENPHDVRRLSDEAIDSMSPDALIALALEADDE